MPRIRDLGINVIPATRAGNYPMYMSISACSDNSDCATSTCCSEGSHSPCDNSCSGSSTKQECQRTNKPPGCDPNSNCPQNSQQGNYAASRLSDEVIAQLRQHLRHRVGTERSH